MATCGSVKIVAGIARWSARASRPVMSYAATRAWYLPTCVNCAMPVTSPIAHTFSAARSRSSTSIPRLADRQPERVETVQVRPPAGGDEEAVEREPLAGAEYRGVPRLDGLYLRAHPDLHAVLPERSLDERRRVCVDEGQKAFRRLDERHLRADPGEELGQLAADRPAAEHEQRRRAPRSSRSPRCSSSSRPRRARDRRDRRRRAGRDHEPVVGKLGLADLDEPGPDDLGVAADELAALLRRATRPGRSRPARRRRRARRTRRPGRARRRACPAPAAPLRAPRAPAASSSSACRPSTSTRRRRAGARRP